MSVHVDEIIEVVARMSIEANYVLGEDIIKEYKEGLKREESPIAKDIFKQLIENAKIAKEERMPLCQDTGMAVVFAEVGQDLEIEGGNLEEAIHQGVKKGYQDGYLRKSVVDGPVIRKNTGDNTPAVIHSRVVSGDKLKLTVAPKGFGSENMSQIKMLRPTDGFVGVKDFILDVVREAGPNPCPPIIVGVGIGGTFEKAALMAKHSLLRPVGSYSEDERIAQFEKELLEDINKLGIGPQGFGGKTTALAVNVETYPTHIAGLPVAVNINCHIARHREMILG